MNRLITIVCVLICASIYEAFGAYKENEKVGRDANSSGEVTFSDVTLHERGSLASVLGDDANVIDSLVIRGNVGAEDFNTMRDATVYGKLKVINLEYAHIENNSVPDVAFYGGKDVRNVNLKRIILPDDIEVIGKGAFQWTQLVEINIPSKLRLIDNGAFNSCMYLNFDKLEFPEGFAEIGFIAFFDCFSLQCDVVLPSTIKRIGQLAFSESKIMSVNIPEGIEFIGGGAFSFTGAKELDIQSTRTDIYDEESPYTYNNNLKSISLSEGLSEIIAHMFTGCLVEGIMELPSSVRRIGMMGLSIDAADIKLNEGLERIETNGMQNASTISQRIVLPSTLRYLGAGSCSQWTDINRLYVKSIIPPECEINKSEGYETPFGNYEPRSLDMMTSTSRDMEIYVPVGTADIYRVAPGWDYFHNFIETDEFPEAGIDMIPTDMTSDSSAIYDLNGRQISDPQPGSIYIRNGRKAVKIRQ